MRLYRFHLPDARNDQSASYIDARKLWLYHAARLAGGYTVLGIADGVWHDALDNAREYREPMHIVEVAVEDGKGEATRRRLVQLFKECFPDQVAVFSAEIGQAWIE